MRQEFFSGSKWETLYLDFERTSLVRVKRVNDRLADCFFWITLKYIYYNYEKTKIKLPINFLHQTLDLLDAGFVGIKRISGRVVIVSDEDVTVDDAASLPTQKFRAMSQTINAWLDKQIDLCRASLKVFAAYRRGILSSYVYNVSLGVNWSIKHYVLQIVVPLMLQEVASFSHEEDDENTKLQKFLSNLTSSHLRRRRRALGVFDYFVSSMWIMIAINDTQGELYKTLLETLTHFLQNDQMSEITGFADIRYECARVTPTSQQLQKTNQLLSNCPTNPEHSNWFYFDGKTGRKFNGSSTLGWFIIRGDMFVLWNNGLSHLPYPRYFLKNFSSKSCLATREGLTVEINTIGCKWGFVVIRIHGLVLCKSSTLTWGSIVKNIPHPPNCDIGFHPSCYCALGRRGVFPFVDRFSLEISCIATIKSLIYTSSRSLQELLCIQQELTCHLPFHLLSRIFAK